MVYSSSDNPRAQIQLEQVSFATFYFLESLGRYCVNPHFLLSLMINIFTLLYSYKQETRRSTIIIFRLAVIMNTNRSNSQKADKQQTKSINDISPFSNQL